MQKQGALLSQAVRVSPRKQESPLQQAVPPWVHCWPRLTQAAVWHVPVLEPEGITQASPEQQSELAVQAPAAGWQVTGAVHAPPTQRPEQHDVPLVHAPPFAVQVVPAVPQTPVARQVLPLQHWALLVQDDPAGVQGTVQRRTSDESDRHRALSQHWSLNWHTSPVAMQQGAVPV